MRFTGELTDPTHSGGPTSSAKCHVVTANCSVAVDGRGWSVTSVVSGVLQKNQGPSTPVAVPFWLPHLKGRQGLFWRVGGPSPALEMGPCPTDLHCLENGMIKGREDDNPMLVLSNNIPEPDLPLLTEALSQPEGCQRAQ